jgi:hypothetical protein
VKCLLRVLGIVLAVYLLLTSAADLAGVLHPSRVSVLLRFQRNFVPIVTAILLIVNPKKLAAGVQRFVYLIALFAVTVWYSFVAMRFLRGFFLGHAAFHVVPLWLLILAILWGTFWMALNTYFAGNTKQSSRK